MGKNVTNSVAPKERINIVYKPATGDSKEGVELPLRILVSGDFTFKEDSRTIEEREPVKVTPQNLSDVMGSMDLSVDFTVDNKLTEKEGESMDVSLQFNEMKDFSPDRILEAVPELKKIIELREALKALKGPLGNVPSMRRAIQDMLNDDDQRATLMKEIGIK